MSITSGVTSAFSSIFSSPSNIATSVLAGLGSSPNGASSVLSSPGTYGLPSYNGGTDPPNPLGGATARPDPLQSFLWYCQMPVVMPGTTQSSIGATANSVINSLVNTAINSVSTTLGSAMGGGVFTGTSAQLPWYYVEEASCPFRRYDVKTIFREGRDRKYPSKYSVDDLRLSIYADSQNNAFQYIQAWNNNIITPFSSSTSTTAGGGWGRPSDYKKPIFIYILDPTMNVLAILEYTECWPTSIDQYSLDSGTSTRIVNHVNFSVGDVFVNLLGVSASFTAGIISNTASNIITSSISGQTLASASSFLSNGVGTVTSSISNLL
jgi:hypothetical protein